jgi:two-component system sensor histidine kinase CssS
MVIQGYAQSIQDGMIPAERLPATINQVEIEAKRLERRISELLYMTKLDYMAKRQQSLEKVRLHELVEVVAERMRWLKPEINWQFDLPETIIDLDLEQWQVVLENVLDNQIRYARSSISVSIHHHLENSEFHLEIRNDGPSFVDGEEQTIFEAFRKGTEGKFGLGLVIVRRICELHAVTVEAHNETNGVVFRFTFRCNR